MERPPENNLIINQNNYIRLGLSGEISITSDMQMTPPLWQKVKRK